MSKPRKRGEGWDEDSLRRAMEAVQNNQLNTNAAALSSIFQGAPLETI